MSDGNASILTPQLPDHWRDSSRPTGAKSSPLDPQDAHCRTAGCACTHDGECYRGWLDRTDHDGKEIAVPCRNCRPETRRLVQAARDRPDMQKALQDPKRGRNPYPTNDRWST